MIASARPSVFLAGPDNVGWALDEEIRLARGALADVAEITDLPSCQIVHAMWWQALLAIPPESLVGKRVVSYIAQDVTAFLASPRSPRVRQCVSRWISRGNRGHQALKSYGVESAIVPYMVDTSIFKPLPEEADQIREIRQRWDLPLDRYLIGSFQRDTLARDLRSPKLEKGPDILAEICGGLHRRGRPIHVVLAGPRRGWLRRRLRELGVPHTYIGQIVEGDDVAINTLPRSQLNALYNIIDLYLVSSRSEGGPQAILEASAAGCKIVSTPVGIAVDTLDPRCVYETSLQGTQLIDEDINTRHLDSTRDVHRRQVASANTPEAAAAAFRTLYEDLQASPPYRPEARSRHVLRPPSFGARFWRKFRPSWTRPEMTVALWHEFHRPPYGGGNQFMIALRRGLRERNIRVVENTERGADVHLLQSLWFDTDRFLRVAATSGTPVVHRIDGPIELIRGTDREKDEFVFKINRDIATVTIMQSAWCHARTVALGYRPVNPVIIRNASDPSIFRARPATLDRRRKTRLIATSWSPNPRKGGHVYKWLDRHLDWSRFEFTFVGRVSEQFDRIQVIPPVGSSELAALLHEHDIYVTASENDPCSNALIEALTCGLPALYKNDGGHPELVGFGGLPFDDPEQIPSRLDALIENYEMFQALIAAPTLDSVVDDYIATMQEALH